MSSNRVNTNFIDNSIPLRGRGRGRIIRGEPLRRGIEKPNLNLNRQNYNQRNNNQINNNINNNININNNNINKNYRNFNYNNRILRRRNFNNRNFGFQQRRFNNFRRNNYSNFGILRRMNPRNNFINRERRTMYYRKLFISNLDPVIRNSQLNELFSRIGKLITCYVNFDSEGNSLRSGKVEYKYPQDARRAINELNDAQIGKYKIKVNYERVKKNLNRNREFNKIRIINRNVNFKRPNFIQPKNDNNRRMVIRRRRK